MDAQTAAPPRVVSSTRQCVCGGWTRYVRCQYCGTTDPEVAAAGLVSTGPLVQLTPEPADAHWAEISPPGPSLPGWEHAVEASSFAPVGASIGSSGSRAFTAVAALPPTTFADAQFGVTSGAFSTYPGTTVVGLPTAFSEPIPGWSQQPVAAPTSWSTPADVRPAAAITAAQIPKQASAHTPGDEPHPPSGALIGSPIASPAVEQPTGVQDRRSVPRAMLLAGAGIVVVAAVGAYLYTQSGAADGSSAPVAVSQPAPSKPSPVPVS